MSIKKSFVRISLGLLILCSLVLLAACGSSDRITAEEKGEKILFETVKQGHLGFAYKREDRPEFRVFRTENEWNDFWSESATRAVVAQESVDPIAPGQPFVDPDPLSEQMSMISWSAAPNQRDMIVGAFFYQNNGYDVTVTDVRKRKNSILVEVTGETFDDDGPGMIAPYHIIKFKKYDLPVDFRFIDKR